MKYPAIVFWNQCAWVSCCIGPDFVSQGDTSERALQSLADTIRLDRQFREADLKKGKRYAPVGQIPKRYFDLHKTAKVLSKNPQKGPIYKTTIEVPE